MSLMSLGASASIPPGLDVSPENNETVSSITKITISYTLGYYGGIGSYANPEVSINGVNVGVTASTPTNDDLVYTLDTPVTNPGTYTIQIGAGSFWYDELFEYDNEEMSWIVKIEGDAPDVFHPIDNGGIEIYPKQGTYNSLQYFEITFNSTSVGVNTTKTARLVTDDVNETTIADGIPVEGAGLINGNVDLDMPVVTPGNYLLIVDEGAFYDFMTDEDFPELRFRYIVAEDGASPDPTPDEVELTPNPNDVQASLSEVLVYYTDYYNVYKYTGDALGAITVTNADNQIVATGEASAGGTGIAANEGRITLTPAITTLGTYTLHIPARVFVLEGGSLYDGEFNTAQTITYNVDPLTGINAIDADVNSEKAVYRVDGTRVPAGTTLPAGLYIIDGRKVVVK